ALQRDWASRASIFHERLVRIAIQPALTRLGRSEHGLTGRWRVFGRMTVRRVVAAPRPAALLARAQMDPGSAHLHAVLAFASLGQPGLRDGFDVGTTLCWWHERPLLAEHLVNEGHGDRSFAD